MTGNAAQPDRARRGRSMSAGEDANTVSHATRLESGEPQSDHPDNTNNLNPGGEDQQSSLGVGMVFDWLAKRGTAGPAALVFLAGALMTLAFSPFDAAPVMIISFAVLLTAIEKSARNRAAFGYGWLFGLGMFLGSLAWIGESFSQQRNVPAELAPFAVFLLCAGMALYVGFAALLTRMLWQVWTDWVSRSLIFAACWTLLEYARGTLFTGFPWNLAGSAWAAWPAMSQGAWLGTVYGLSFASLLVSGLLWPLLYGQRRAGAVLCLIAAAGIAGGWYGYGAARLAAYQPEYDPTIRIRLVQANIRQSEKWLSSRIDDHFQNHLALSRMGVGGGSDSRVTDRGRALLSGDPEPLPGKLSGIKLLIWPETAVQRGDFDRGGSLERWRISRLLEFGAFALVGVPRLERRDTGGYWQYNSMMAVGARGDIRQRYDKHHLVPFGEYVPFAGILSAVGIGQLTGGRGYASGPGPQTVSLPGIPPFSPLICYESIFPAQVVAKPGTNTEGPRPRWLLNISNDAWFGTSSGPWQHLSQARLRAIEEGLPVIRSTATGISAVIGPMGRILKSIPLGRRAVLDSPLPTPLEIADSLSRFKLAIVILLSLSIGVVGVVRLLIANR